MSESKRLSALVKTGLLDTVPEERFDRLTRLAAKVFKVQTALISLVDHDRQWFKSRVNLNVCETSRDVSFCAHAIRNPDEVMVVHEAATDPRFADNPLVTGEPKIRFYAGAPLVTSEGYALGTLCILDPAPRPDFSVDDAAVLADIARSVMTEIELAAKGMELTDKEVAIRELKHRMGNMYAHVGSFISLLSRGEEDKDAFVLRLRERITSLAQAQSLVAQSGDAGVPLADLVETVIGPVCPEPRSDRFVMTAPEDLRVGTRSAFLLTLLLGELATNAVKYGGFSSRGTRVNLGLSVNGTGELEWTELADLGADDLSRDHKGFGTQILSRIAPAGLGGKAIITRRPEGMLYKLSFDPEKLAA